MISYSHRSKGGNPWAPLEGGRNTAKTHTSTEVKRRYNESVYSRIYIQLPKDLVAAFKAKCEKEGIAQRSVIAEAIEKFIRE